MSNNPSQLLAKIVNHHLAQKNINQSTLAKMTGLSKSTISRMANNRVKYYTPKLQAIVSVALALGLTFEEYEALQHAAYPWLATCTQSILDGVSYDKTMEKLYDSGLPLPIDIN